LQVGALVVDDPPSDFRYPIELALYIGIHSNELVVAGEEKVPLEIFGAEATDLRSTVFLTDRVANAAGARPLRRQMIDNRLRIRNGVGHFPVSRVIRVNSVTTR
jgi:hypothetical protein